MIKLVVNKKDVTRYVETVKWSGDISTVARTLSVNFTELQPDVGDKVKFSYNKKTVFEGMVMFADGKSFEAMDYGIYLSKNKAYKQYEGTPQSIAGKVCKEFGVKAGKFAARKNKVKVVSTGNLSAYQVIQQAYEGKRKNPKRKYLMLMSGHTLSIEKSGETSAGSLKAEIETASRSASIKDMVNRVVIINDKSKKTGEVSNASDRKKYGSFQGVYRSQKGKNDKTEAKQILQGLVKAGKVTAIGNIKCIAGRSVTVTHKETGIKGRQIIKSDTHTFDGVNHDMSLEFYYG